MEHLSLIFIFISFMLLVSPLKCISHIQVKAKLLECSNQPTCNAQEKLKPSDEIKNENAAGNQLYPEFQGPTLVSKCVRKIYITAQIKNEGQVSGDDDYVVVEDVEDPITGESTNLLYPIFLKIHREQPQIIYPLEFQQVVNAGVHEEVLNSTIDICDGSLCGITSYNDMVMSSNGGFCCSCHSVSFEDIKSNSLHEAEITSMSPDFKSLKRSLRKTEREVTQFGNNYYGGRIGKKGEKILEEMRKMSNTNEAAENYDDTEVASYHKHHSKYSTKIPSIMLLNNKLNMPFNSVSHETKRQKRQEAKEHSSFRIRLDKERVRKVLQLREKIIEKKERQNCSGAKGNAPTAHCLRLSNLWYSVYSLGEAVVVQELSLQVFQKRDSSDGETYWIDLTGGNILRLGTYYPQARDELPTVAFSYSSSLDPSGKCKGNLCPIDASSYFILVPSHLQAPSTIDDHPEAKGGPAEYLVVSRDDISADGRGCDQVGTLFEGFLEQPNRCQQQQGSCLNNQPVDLWLQDMEHRLKDEPGQYFLDTFGTVASSPLPSAANLIKEDNVVLEFYAPFRSLVEVEIRADDNALIRKGWGLQIQSIAVDSSAQQHTIIEVLTVNVGLLPGGFRPWLVECTEELPPNSSPEGPLVFIPPMQRHIFRIIMEGTLPKPSITCTLELHNTGLQLVASRQVVVKKQARCLCAYHCSCYCHSQIDSLTCVPLMQEEYAAAGYTEGLPRRSGIPAQVPFQLVAFNIILMTITLLLLLGKLKVLFGIGSKTIRTFGLDFLRSSECCLQHCMGPVRKREIMQRTGAEIFLNMLFFILYPTAIFYLWLRNLCQLSGMCNSCCPGSSRSYTEFPLLPSYNESKSARSTECDQLADETEVEKYDNGQYQMEADDTSFILETMASLSVPPSRRESQTF